MTSHEQLRKRDDVARPRYQQHFEKVSGHDEPPPLDARALRRRLVDPRSICERLGLGLRARRQTGGLIIRCPWHDDRTPSCSVRVSSDGTIGVRCHACGVTGDVLSLIARARGLDVRTEFRAVLGEAARLADSSGPTESPPAVPARPRTYPDRAPVARLWSRSISVVDDPQCAGWLAARGIDPAIVAARDLARAIPRDIPLPAFARFRGMSWFETGHRLLLPTWDASGSLRSVRAGRVVDSDAPKRLPPAGHLAAGLVLADPLAQAVLARRGTSAWPSPLRLVIVEGEPDYLTWATRSSDADVDAPAIVGILAGAWCVDVALRVPNGARVAIRTHADEAGDRYAADIIASLAHRCDVWRTS